MLAIDLQSARKAWSFAVVALTIWGFFIVRKTVLMFVLALMFSYLLFPVIGLLQRKVTLGARIPALLLLFVGLPTTTLGIGILFRRPFLAEVHNLEQQIRSADFRNNLAQWHVLGVPVGEKIADSHNLSRIQGEAAAWLPAVDRFLSRASRDVTNLFLVPILAFLMLKDGRLICDSILNLLLLQERGVELQRQRLIIEGILDDAHDLILQYMQALVLLCFAVLIVFSIALSVMGIRYALLLALLAFPLEFIPLIGPFVAGAIIVGVCEFNHYPHIGMVLAFLALYRIFQDYVLSPHLMKRSIKLHPLLIIFGVFAGGEIGGLGGIFLSVPMLSVARLLFYEYRKRTSSIQYVVPESTAEPLERIQPVEPSRV
jgi:predicted PurR-regulated permease PerM